jgi:hypothetical protein
MTEWKVADFDTCHCGDYRHQHVEGTGRCKLGSLCTPSYCQKFRLSHSATKIPEHYASALVEGSRHD